MIVNSSILRSKPHLKVLQGWNGNESRGLTKTAKPKADEGIESGMAIRLDAQGEWVKADTAFVSGPIYFAWEDQSAPIVEAGGVLLGLSSLGDYKMQTAQIDPAATFTVGAELAVGTGATAGLLIARADASASRVGFCDKAKFSLGASQTTTTYTPPVDNSSASLDVIQFTTSFEVGTGS